MNSSPVAIITGAAGNLGQAVAVHLGGLGYRLLLIDLNQPDWDGETDAVSIGNVDLTLPEHAQEVVNQAWEYFGQIDAVVNIRSGFKILNKDSPELLKEAHHQAHKIQPNDKQKRDIDDAYEDRFKP